MRCDSGEKCHKISRKLADSGVEFRHAQKEATDGGLCAGAADVRGVFSAAHDGAGAEASYSATVASGLERHTQREGDCYERV